MTYHRDHGSNSYSYGYSNNNSPPYNPYNNTQSNYYRNDHQYSSRDSANIEELHNYTSRPIPNNPPVQDKYSLALEEIRREEQAKYKDKKIFPLSYLQSKYIEKQKAIKKDTEKKDTGKRKKMVEDYPNIVEAQLLIVPFDFPSSLPSFSLNNNSSNSNNNNNNCSSTSVGLRLALADHSRYEHFMAKYNKNLSLTLSFHRLLMKIGFNSITNASVSFFYQVFLDRLHLVSNTPPTQSNNSNNNISTHSLFQYNSNNNSSNNNNNSRSSSKEREEEEEFFLELLYERPSVLLCCLANLAAKAHEIKTSSVILASILGVTEEERELACILELTMAKNLHFYFMPDLPHVHLRPMSRLLRGISQGEVDEILMLSFSFASDAMLSFVCTSYPPVLIAVACIFLGSSFGFLREGGRRLPEILAEDICGKDKCSSIAVIDDLLFLILLNYDELGKEVSKVELEGFDIISRMVKSGK